MGKKVCMTVWNHFITDARVTKEAKTLIKHGYDVAVVAIHDPLNTKRKEEKDGLRIVRFERLINKIKRQRATKTKRNNVAASEMAATQPAPQVKSQSIFSTVKRLLRKALILLDKGYINLCFFYFAWKARADVYHAHDLNTALPVYIAAKLRRAKYIYDAHEISTDRVGWKNKRLWTFIERRIVCNADGFITTNGARAEFFRQTYGRDDVTIVRNVPEYVEVQKSNKIRDELGISSDVPILLYQGGLQADRGLELMVDMMRDIPNAVLVFIGDGRLRPILEAKIASHNLSNRVKLLGRVSMDELLTYTASATVGLQLLKNTCLNHYTACSNKLYEYLMAELPVVASDFPELRKVVEQERIGLLVDPDDREAVIDSINTLLSDERFYRSCRRNAARAKRNYHWSLEEANLLSLYQ